MAREYRVVDDGGLLGTFTSKAKAASFVKEMRDAGRRPRISISEKKAPRKASKSKSGGRRKAVSPPRPSRRPLKPAEDVRINAWLTGQGLEPVERDMTFRQLYSELLYYKTMEEALGDCSGRKSKLVSAVAEAMDVPERTIRGWLEMAEKKRKRKPRPGQSDAGPSRIRGKELKALAAVAGLVGESMHCTSPTHVVNRAHTALVTMDYPGGSLLGLGWGRDDCIDVSSLKRVSSSAEYQASLDGGDLVLAGRSGSVFVPVSQQRNPGEFRFAQPSMGFDVDPDAFLREIRRASIVVGGGNGWSGRIALYEDEGDLMMRAAEPGGNEMDADVGDSREVNYGDMGSGTFYDSSDLSLMARMFSLADGPCTLHLQRNGMAVGSCSVGDATVRMAIVPSEAMRWPRGSCRGRG